MHICVGQLECLRMLPCDRVAMVKNKDGVTAILRAALMDADDIVQYLVHSGLYDLHTCIDALEILGSSLLFGDGNVVEVLQKWGQAQMLRRQSQQAQAIQTHPLFGSVKLVISDAELNSLNEEEL